MALVDPANGLFGVVVDLIKFGAIGLAAFIFLGITLVLLKGTPVDKQTAQLRQSYLRYGTLCALAFGAIAFFQANLTSSHSVQLTFSPNFDENLLPEPTIMLLGQTVKPSDQFKVDQDMQVVIVVDAALKRARELASNVASLKNTASELLKQSEVLSAQLQSAIKVTPPLAVKGQMNDAITASAASRKELAEAIKSDNFHAAQEISKGISTRLHGLGQ